MNQALIDRIVQAVLYEGYLLYPYRPSSIKNRQRWTFGGVFPQSYSEAQGSGEPWTMQTECLITGGPDTALQARVRFLHLLERTVGQLSRPLAEWPATGEPAFEPVATLSAGDRVHQTWEEAVERDVALPDCVLRDVIARPFSQAFSFGPSRMLVPVRGPGGQIIGVLVRQQQLVAGSAEVSGRPVDNDLFRITVRILNQTPMLDTPPSRGQAQLQALASTHTILHVRSGAFVSLLDPPRAWQAQAAECQNVGTWPVLVGTEGERDALLSSPIILYDYPQVAPESPGDLFDATEIDEILTLRILTMTDEEKREMLASDERGRALLERTEALGKDDLMKLHGTVRSLRPIIPERSPECEWENTRRQLDCVQIGGFEVRKGDRVRLRPRGRADILDIALNGKTATVESVEQDFENQVYLAVSVDDDPGKDLAEMGQPGHRFFYRPEEVEPLGEGGIS
jgi:hypothetical protein